MHMTTSTFDQDLHRPIRQEGALGRELLRLVVAVFLPPLAVFFRVGFTAHFVINFLLTLIGYVPGLVHAVWVLAQTSRYKVKVQ